MSNNQIEGPTTCLLLPLRISQSARAHAQIQNVREQAKAAFARLRQELGNTPKL
jgi:hypothetical protein